MATNSDMDISRKLAYLLMILSGNRVNMLSLLKVTNMFLTDNKCTFVFHDVLKHTRPNFNDKPITFRAFPKNESLCPVTTLHAYLNIRLTRSDEEELFITTTQPYKRVSPETLARWIKVTMSASGINTGLYSAHSCRTTSTTSASLKGVSFTTIIKSASWSGESTFRKYYLKEIQDAYNLNKENFGTELLKKFN